MVYDKEKDILGMYRYKCEDCASKFLDRPSIIVHYRMMHNKIIQIKDRDRKTDISILSSHVLNRRVDGK